MSKYLISRVETYRVDTELEAKNFIEEQRANSTYDLAKYSSEYKERKKQGEVIDAWYKVTLTKKFNSERDPEQTYIESEEEE